MPRTLRKLTLLTIGLAVIALTGLLSQNPFQGEQTAEASSHLRPISAEFTSKPAEGFSYAFGETIRVRVTFSATINRSKNSDQFERRLRLKFDSGHTPTMNCDIDAAQGRNYVDCGWGATDTTMRDASGIAIADDDWDPFSNSDNSSGRNAGTIFGTRVTER